ncbi:MAG: ribbon-helix-helix domain-containing protein [Sphingopyxis sp.]|nr:ribbon-helix-helix domain-containing protein [Sphingopyxis sp.]
MPDGDGLARLRLALAQTRTFESVPGKHSATIAGHATSIRIESVFWDALKRESERFGVPVNALIAEIDVARLASPQPPNLASAIRLWLYERARTSADVSNI